MFYFKMDRAKELGRLRRERVLTDVCLVSGNNEIHAHKIILSLHSFYFRTLFSTEGFQDSHSDKIQISSVPYEILKSIVDYIYTGDLNIDNDDRPEESVVLFLEAEALLQLNDQLLRERLESVLVTELRAKGTLETILKHWNYAVLFELKLLMTEIEKILDLNLENLVQNVRNQELFLMLGFEEMERIVSRESLCLKSERTLLRLLMIWAESNVSSSEDYPLVAQLLNQIHVDRRTTVSAITRQFPDFEVSLCSSHGHRRKRSCPKFSYIVEFKLSKNQLRNIEDFVDRGEKSSFYSFNFPGGGVRRLAELTSTGSICGTCNGNYFRPMTKDSHMFVRDNRIYIVGGQADSDSKTKQFRRELLCFDPVNKCWVPPVKKALTSSKNYKKLDIECIEVTESSCYVLFKGQTDQKDVVYFIDEICLDFTKFPGRKPSPRFLSNLPSWFRPCSSLVMCADGDMFIYICGGGVFARFNVGLQAWEKLQKPIGDLGEEKPWLAGLGSCFFLLSGKPKSGDSSVTNTVQVYDVETSSWSLVCNLNLRFTPSFLGLHDDTIFIVGWCPARKNFIASVDHNSGGVSILVSGVDGIFSNGIIIHQSQIPSLIL